MISATQNPATLSSRIKAEIELILGRYTHRVLCVWSIPEIGAFGSELPADPESCRACEPRGATAEYSASHLCEVRGQPRSRGSAQGQRGWGGAGAVQIPE